MFLSLSEELGRFVNVITINVSLMNCLLHISIRVAISEFVVVDLCRYMLKFSREPFNMSCRGDVACTGFSFFILYFDLC